VRATAEVMVPAATARFGIISDIHDTVLWTNVTNKLNMAILLAGRLPEILRSSPELVGAF
jgi:phosphatidate phosphatase APP1